MEAGAAIDAERGKRRAADGGGLDHLAGELGTAVDGEPDERRAASHDGLDRLVSELGAARNAERDERRAAGGDGIGQGRQLRLRCALLLHRRHSRRQTGALSTFNKRSALSFR